MEYNKEIAVGIKFFIGPIDLTGISTTDFISKINFKFTSDTTGDDPSGVLTGDNVLSCKYFDDEKGYMYVMFDKPIHPSTLPYVDDEEFIYKKLEE